MTALHRAAYKGHEGVVRLLCEHGCDVNAKNNVPLDLQGSGLWLGLPPLAGGLAVGDACALVVAWHRGFVGLFSVSPDHADCRAAWASARRQSGRVGPCVEEGEEAVPGGQPGEGALRGPGRELARVGRDDGAAPGGV